MSTLAFHARSITELQLLTNLRIDSYIVYEEVNTGREAA